MLSYQVGVCDTATVARLASRRLSDQRSTITLTLTLTLTPTLTLSLTLTLPELYP